jgi:5-formyltetrahydrofolate cyclo-ligase
MGRGRRVEGAELKVWRRSERQRLLALRTSVLPAERRRLGEEIEAKLRILLSERPGASFGVYWPFQAEFDPRPLIDWAIA